MRAFHQSAALFWGTTQLHATWERAARGLSICQGIELRGNVSKAVRVAAPHVLDVAPSALLVRTIVPPERCDAASAACPLLHLGQQSFGSSLRLEAELEAVAERLDRRDLSTDGSLPIASRTRPCRP